MKNACLCMPLQHAANGFHQASLASIRLLWLPSGFRWLPPGFRWLPPGFCWLPPSFYGLICSSANRLHWLPLGCFCLLTGCEFCLPKHERSKNAAKMQPVGSLYAAKMQTRRQKAVKPKCSQFEAYLQPDCSQFAAKISCFQKDV